MARALHEEVCSPLKELIHQISGYEDGSDAFTQVEKGMKAEIKKGGTMYFLHRKEIDSLIQGMSDKYLFHGFARQAEALIMFYNKFLMGNLSRCDLMTRLNIIKFLVGISDNPIKKFATRPEDFLTEPIVKPDEIDWKAYLNEGIEWRPPCDEESTDFSDFCSSTDIDQSEDETAEVSTTFKCDSTTTIISMDNPESIDVFNQLSAPSLHVHSVVLCIDCNRRLETNSGIGLDEFVDRFGERRKFRGS